MTPTGSGDENERANVSRRQLLVVAGTATTASLTGCGQRDGDGAPVTDTATETETISRIPIETPADVRALADADDEEYPLAGHYRLVDDIDLSNNEHTPIGDTSTPFTGSFVGEGHTIEKVSIDPDSDRHRGLFGVLDGGSIRRLTVASVTVPDGSDVVAGSLVGRNDGGTVKHATATGDVTGEYFDCVGGLVGTSSGEIRQSSAEGTIEGSGLTVEAGGLVGRVSGGTVADSSAIGSVRAESHSGGLVGRNDGGEIRGSSAEGSLVNIGADASAATGGLVGESSGEIRQCNVEVTVEGGGAGGYTGGLVGRSDGGTVVRSSALGDATGGLYVGGLVGRDIGGAIRQSSAAVDVNGTHHLGVTGGLVASLDGGRVVGSGASGNVTGDTSAGGLVCENVGGEVRDSWSSSRVTAREGAGGLIAVNSESSTVIEAAAIGPVTGALGVGGLVGTNHGSTIRQSIAHGDVVQEGGLADGSDIGGFAGRNTGEIREAEARGNVEAVRCGWEAGCGTANVGGFVGRISAGGTVSRSAAKGDVIGHKAVGGFVGKHVDGRVQEAFSTGSVRGTDGTGGFVGNNSATVTVSYWDVPASGLEGSAGGEGLGELADSPPADEMTGDDAPAHMAGFDFDETWETVTDPAEYPELQVLPILK